MNTDKELAQAILDMFDRRHTNLLGEYTDLVERGVQSNDKKLYRDLRMKKSGQIEEVDHLRHEFKKAVVAQGIVL